MLTESKRMKRPNVREFQRPAFVARRHGNVQVFVRPDDRERTILDAQ
jgi:hypothetical protein